MISTKHRHRSLFFVAAVLTGLGPSRANAGLLPAGANYFIEGTAYPGRFTEGSSPASISTQGNYNGLTWSDTYNNSYLSTSTVAAVNADYALTVGGGSSYFNFTGVTTVDSGVSFDYGQGYDQYLYGQMGASMTYHLAAGDTLSYDFSAAVGVPFNGNLYAVSSVQTITSPGDGTVSVYFPPTLFADLELFYLYGGRFLTSQFEISISVTRGSGETDDTTVNVDPGLTVQLTSSNTPPTSVPEPSTMFLSALAVSLTATWHVSSQRHKRRRAVSRPRSAGNAP